MSDDCKDGSACASDFSQETIVPKKTTYIKDEYIIPLICLFLLLLGIGFNFYDFPFFKATTKLIWFGTIYFLIGGKIIFRALKLVFKACYF